MKILLVDTVMYGHHKSYFEALMAGVGQKHSVAGIVPREYENPHYELFYADFYKKNMKAEDTHFLAYAEWMWNIYRIVKRERPDVVHFLYGDILYRYFGIGLKLFSKTNVVVTFHQIRRSRLRDLSIKRICKNIRRGILHTDKLVDDLRSLSIDNIKKVEYPCFTKEEAMEQGAAQKALGIDAEGKRVLLALGGTRYDKGLDLLLDALGLVTVPFYLLIAGYPEAYDEKYIAEHTRKYRGQVKCILKYLSDEELSLCIAASDFIVLPYRKTFDGASGPLGEGVEKNKVIIGPNHGSLGTIISQNHLGYLFESEDAEQLSKTIESAVKGAFEPDEKYKAYQEAISVKIFVENYLEIYEECSK